VRPVALALLAAALASPARADPPPPSTFPPPQEPVYAPPPLQPLAPAQPRYEQRRPNTGMLIGGLAGFGALWLSSTLTGYLTGDMTYAIPIGGPIYEGFKQLDQARTCYGTLCAFLADVLGAVAILDGVLAGAALGIGIAGIFMTRKVPVQTVLAPAPGGATLAVGGAF
jgi:hypothetical protein